MLMTAVIMPACSSEDEPNNNGGNNNGGGNGSYNGHDYVDLGLPSGTLWATCNVGATNPEGYGDYFAWGETETKDFFSEENYKFFEEDSIIKYNNYDGLTLLEEEDDAAMANWGNGWCVPSVEQWRELKQNTTNTWTTQNGVNGRLFTASNGNSLFVPAAGFRWIDELYGVGGNYWSSSLGTVDSCYPWYLDLHSGSCDVDGFSRSYGLSVRPVRSAR